ncbi:porin family protein [Arsenicitalea aurantiaca]|uniref:Porin family protein n=1 Tax=Arsenicitalea aurantiaca TaxID=1783274 RepID=A0A433XF65_9HYPH|nr:outer membrane protein [Arsenicitalea aurantiaca]RUT32696.1 porin family protein [Arsenicitalea aurantiaca]
MTALRLGIATAATALMTASAFAADLYIPIEQPFIPDVSAPLGWSGAYVGAHVGYGWGEARIPFGPFDIYNELDGWLAGAQAGYNFNLDGVVIGVEGDFSWADLEGAIGSEPGEGFLTNSVDWLATLRGRVGLPVDALLVYGTAGIAFANGATTTAVFELEEGEPTTQSVTNTHVGWVVGAGIEAMVTESISLKAEYLYHEFGTETYVSDVGPVGGGLDVGFNVSTAKIGLNFHF